jgi:hypothetical protein
MAALLVAALLGPVASARATDLFPASSLFLAPLASPREPRSHVTWLILDLPGDSLNVGSVGFGDSFGLVRWRGWGTEDYWQVGLSGAVLAQFNLDSDSMDLINADYLVGFPVGYRNGPWSGRLRLYHQSSHLGDEFLLYPQSTELRQKRINLSFETAEMLGGWEWEGLRITGGPAYILHTDTPLKRRSAQLGIDYLSARPVYRPELLPFASATLHSWEETGWKVDFDAKAGINLRSPYAEKRAIQLFAEYFRGNLPFGQFYKLRAEYWGAGVNVSF